MYHDEFARRPARPISTGKGFLPSLVMQVGGGLSLAFAASLNRPALLVIFSFGGLLPTVASCLSLVARDLVQMLTKLAPKPVPVRPSALPVPHILVNRRALSAASHGHRRVGSSR